jgi:hypothetical protein
MHKSGQEMADAISLNSSPKINTMKKTGIVTALLMGSLALSFNSSAQGVYVGIGGGYGFAAAKMDLGPDQKTTQTQTNGVGPSTSTYTSNTYSLGKGINLGLYGGYMINKNLGAELGIAYLIGNSSKTTYENDMTSITTNPFAATFTSTQNNVQTYTVKGSMLRLVPAIRIQCGEDKIHPYAVAGLIIGMAGKATGTNESVTTNTQSSGTPPANSDDITTITYSGGISMGFHGAIGVNYMVSDKLGIFAELSGNYQNYSPGKGVVTTSTSNGTDNLPKMTTSQIETDYSSSYTTTSNAAPSPGTPTTASSMRMPFSSYGFNIGVHFSFGGK